MGFFSNFSVWLSDEYQNSCVFNGDSSDSPDSWEFQGILEDSMESLSGYSEGFSTFPKKVCEVSYLISVQRCSAVQEDLIFHFFDRKASFL